ncbi:MAG: SRPBCC family protein [Pseudomonadota bacterium]
MANPELDLNPERFGIYGTSEDGRPTILYTRYLNHPIDKVWRAISIPEHRQVWFPELSLDLQVGGKAIVDFSGGDCPAPEDNPADIYRCEITAYDPPHVLEYKGIDEHHRFDLQAEGDGCVLKFMATLPTLEEFDDESNTIHARYSVACGWHYKLDVMEWDINEQLDGYELESYAGPNLTKLYLEYLKTEK